MLPKESTLSVADGFTQSRRMQLAMWRGIERDWSRKVSLKFPESISLIHMRLLLRWRLSEPFWLWPRVTIMKCIKSM